MARAIIPAVALAAVLSSGAAAGAVVVDTYTNHFDIEFYDNSPDVWLRSDVWFDSGFASLSYTVTYQLVDVGLDVTWYDHNGAVLVHGGGWYSSGHYAYSLDVEWVGTLTPTIPYRLFGGKADFSAGQVQKFPCFSKICPTSHYDWLHNAPPAPQKAVPTAAAGVDGIEQTRSTLSVQMPSPDDPGNRAADIVADLYRFTSTAQQAAGGWQYRYTVTNLSDGDVVVALDALQLSGVLAAQGSLEAVVDSAIAPAYLRTTPTVTQAGGAVFDMRFDALAPVPDVAGRTAMAVGLAALALLMRRRRQRGAP